MARFFIKLILFLITGFLLVNLVAAIYAPFARSRYERDGSETFEAVRRARSPSSCSNIVLGDSVCHQLLLQQNLPDTLNLSCNQAVSVCGQFLLARSAVAHDPQARKITLVLLPQSFTNDLEQKYTFNYFVKPFYIHADLRSGMDALVTRRLDRRPVYRLMLFPMFRYSDLLSATDYSSPVPAAFSYLSPVAIDYLHQLADLCHAHHLQLRLVCPPISKTSGYDQAVFLKEISTAQLDDVFAGYTATMRVVSPDLLIDNVHFKPEFLDANSKIFLQTLSP
jgi:hypothetical protein